MRVGVVLGLTPSPSKAIPDDEVLPSLHRGSSGLLAIRSIPAFPTACCISIGNCTFLVWPASAS